MVLQSEAPKKEICGVADSKLLRIVVGKWREIPADREKIYHPTRKDEVIGVRYWFERTKYLVYEDFNCELEKGRSGDHKGKGKLRFKVHSTYRANDVQDYIGGIPFKDAPTTPGKRESDEFPEEELHE